MTRDVLLCWDCRKKLGQWREEIREVLCDDCWARFESMREEEDTPEDIEFCEMLSSAFAQMPAGPCPTLEEILNCVRLEIGDQEKYSAILLHCILCDECSQIAIRAQEMQNREEWREAHEPIA